MTESSDVGKTTNKLSHPLTHHTETLDDPVAGRNGPIELFRDEPRLDVTRNIERGDTTFSVQFRYGQPEVFVERFENIFKEQGEERTGQLNPLVAIEVPVIWLQFRKRWYYKIEDFLYTLEKVNSKKCII